MIECALYGVAKKKFGWNGENFRRIEKIYTKEGHKILLHTRIVRDPALSWAPDCSMSPYFIKRFCNTQADAAMAEQALRNAPPRAGGMHQVHDLIYKEVPDRNRKKTSIITTVRKMQMGHGQDPDAFLALLGFKGGDTNLVDVKICDRKRYIIEFSRFVQDSAAPASKPVALYKYYLVKVATVVDDPNIGEAVLDDAYRDLEDDIKLVKPALHCF